jgi:drug/metabolite transporter (DMT)-like permease
MDPSNAGRRDNIPLGVIFAVITFACFSTADAFVKWLSSGFSVVQLMVFTSLAAMVPVTYMAAREGGVRALMPKDTRLVLFRALLMALDSLCAYFAFSRLPLANVYTLIFAAPLLVAALSAPMLGERTGWKRWAAVGAGFVGVLVILRPGISPLDIGYIGGIGAAVFFGLALLITRRLGSGESSASLVFTTFVAKIVVALPFLPFAWMPMTALDLGLMCMAGLFVGLAQTFVVFAFRYAPAPVVAPFQFSQMVWAMIFGVLLFGDIPDAFVITGSLIVVGSGLYIFLQKNE